MSKSIHVGKSPRIRIKSVDGDLSIIGWDGEDMLIKADVDEVRFEHKDGEVSLSSNDDLSLRIPKGASILLDSVSGDTSIRSVMGDMELKDVSGDLSIREAGSITIDAVHADFNLRGARKDLYVKQAQGDVSIRDVEGHVTLDSVVW